MVDLRDSLHVPEALDQGQLSSCTANAASNLLRYMLRRGGERDFQPSRQFIYYNTRVKIAHQSPRVDEGACLRDVCKALKAYHACPEEVWPYGRDPQRIATQEPSAAAYAAAKKHSVTYVRVPQTEYHFCACLQQGLPIMIGLK